MFKSKAKRQQHALAQAALDGDEPTLASLLAEGVSPDAAGSDGFPAVVNAAGGGHRDALETLVQAGARLEAKNRAGSTALIWAAAMGKHDCVGALLSWGANKDAVRNDGCTGLILAACYGQLDSVRLLVYAGADRTKRATSGKSALDWAVAKRHDEVAGLLRHVPALDGAQPRADAEPEPEPEGTTALRELAESGDPLGQVVAMGFEVGASSAALSACGGDAQAAITRLLAEQPAAAGGGAMAAAEPEPEGTEPNPLALADSEITAL